MKKYKEMTEANISHLEIETVNSFTAWVQVQIM